MNPQLSDGREKKVQQDIARRWSEKLAAGGWLAVPTGFLRGYRNLSNPLSNQEFALVLHIMSHKWGTEAPFPSAKRLGKFMGISATAVRNHLRSLMDKGYLKKITRNGKSNVLDLSPLFTALENLKSDQQASPDLQRVTEEIGAAL